MQNVRVAAADTQPNNVNGTYHYTVYDAAGQTWIDDVNGQVNVQMNPQGAITNATTFNGQITEIQDLIRTAQASGTAQQCIQQAFRFLKQFDLAKETTTATTTTTAGPSRTTFTNSYLYWTTAADMTNLQVLTSRTFKTGKPGSSA